MKPQPKLQSDSGQRFLIKNIGLVLVISFWLLSNFLIVFAMEISGPNIPSGIPAYCTFGIVGSQIIFLGFMLSMYPCTFVVRFFGTTALCSFLLLAIWTGGMIIDSSVIGKLLPHLGSLPSLILAFAGPFALAKYSLNRPLTFVDQAPEPGAKLSILSLLIGTALVAGAISFFQVEDKSDQAAIGVAILICGGVGLIVFIPYSLQIMASRFPWPIVIVVSVIAWLMTFGVSETLTTWSLSGLEGWEQIGWSFTAFSLFFSLGVALIALKSSGVTTLDDKSVGFENTFQKQY